MTGMLPWHLIDTVLLDLDGTLLDLHYDNYFWQEYVPQCYAKQHGFSFEQSARMLMEKYQSVEGSMQWYCVDYWSRELGLNIVELKAEIKHLIRIHPSVVEFLKELNASQKYVILVTNAHQHSLSLKLNETNLSIHFNAIVCAHEFGLPKENVKFWNFLLEKHPFNVERTLLIDDSLPVLRSAKSFGIKHLLSISQPDSKKPKKTSGEFPLISDFTHIQPIFAPPKS